LLKIRNEIVKESASKVRRLSVKKPDLIKSIKKSKRKQINQTKMSKEKSKMSSTAQKSVNIADKTIFKTPSDYTFQFQSSMQDAKIETKMAKSNGKDEKAEKDLLKNSNKIDCKNETDTLVKQKTQSTLANSKPKNCISTVKNAIVNYLGEKFKKFASNSRQIAEESKKKDVI
jgi:hypothetical protein